jgi:hypothetical protein
VANVKPAPILDSRAVAVRHQRGKIKAVGRMGVRGQAALNRHVAAKALNPVKGN